MRNNKNADGNFEFKYLPVNASVKNKRRFIRWCEKNQWELYCGYDELINLRSRRLKSTKILFHGFIGAFRWARNLKNRRYQPQSKE